MGFVLVRDARTVDVRQVRVHRADDEEDAQVRGGAQGDRPVLRGAVAGDVHGGGWSPSVGHQQHHPRDPNPHADGGEDRGGAEDRLVPHPWVMQQHGGVDQGGAHHHGPRGSTHRQLDRAQG